MGPWFRVEATGASPFDSLPIPDACAARRKFYFKGLEEAAVFTPLPSMNLLDSGDCLLPVSYC